ncbi:hypothetical protein MRB53_032424 [Persea americana]|uniref:Uncharacterized protein n=1 Tax=Persea americana TaxID=3435 RepID=A0ACC2KSC3_PERAE|nr:hypothetical protein MRB53_032424 [Persea americana]
MRLTNLHLENNLIFGSIPVGIENLASLNLLSLQGNLLTGSLPIGIGKLVKFEALALFTNKLSGQIPSSIGNLMRLSRLVLFEIDFEGGLPPSIGGRRYLESLDLPVNDHSGTIPREVLTISSTTRYINLSYNCFTRSLLMETDSVNQLSFLDVSNNRLSGNDVKAPICEYMPNGSLDKWLYPVLDGQNQLRSLNLTQMLNIAIGVAFALDYLHHHYQMLVVHCDLKPKNILLDNDMIVHVGDFGQAKFLLQPTSDASHDQTNSIAIKGSIGYVAPGKSHTDDMFKDNLTLHKFAKKPLPAQVMQIADQQHFIELEAMDQCKVQDMRARMQDCLISVFEIGVLYSIES